MVVEAERGYPCGGKRLKEDMGWGNTGAGHTLGLGSASTVCAVYEVLSCSFTDVLFSVCLLCLSKMCERKRKKCRGRWY